MLSQDCKVSLVNPNGFIMRDSDPTVGTLKMSLILDVVYDL